MTGSETYGSANVEVTMCGCLLNPHAPALRQDAHNRHSYEARQAAGCEVRGPSPQTPVLVLAPASSPDNRHVVRGPCPQSPLGCCESRGSCTLYKLCDWHTCPDSTKKKLERGLQIGSGKPVWLQNQCRGLKALTELFCWSLYMY